MVALLFLLSFLLGTSFNFLETAAFTLFLGQFTARTLPWIYIINAVVVSAITFGYLRLGRRLSFSKQLAANLGVLLLLLAAFRVGLALTNGPWVAFALPILFQIVVSLGNIAYWTLAGRVVNVRQAKRLFGLLGAGMWVAIVITGFLIPLIVRIIGTANLLVLSVAGMAAALMLLVYVTHTYAPQVNRTNEVHDSGEPLPVRSLLRNRFIVLMFSLSVFAWISFFFVDNMFYNRVGARFPDEHQLASFLGLYLAFLGILTLLNNSLLTAPIIGRFGVRGGLLVLPGALLAGVLLFTVTGTIAGIVPILFWLATLNKMIDLSLGFSVDQAGQTILYQPLPARERTRVQTVDEGMVRMAAVGAAGVLLLILNQVLGASVVQLGYVLLVVVVAWIGAVFLTGREYPRALRHALVRRRLAGTTLTVSDPTSVEVLKQALHDPNPQVALAALNLLESAGEPRPTPYLTALLAHPSAEVRVEALHRLCVKDSGEVATLVQKTIREDPAPEVRAAALEGFAALGETDVIETLTPYLADPEPLIRQGAIVGLLQHGTPGARSAAWSALSNLAADKRPEQRIQACQIIAAAASSDLAMTLAPLVEDDDPEVRRQALLTVAQGAYGTLWPRVTAALADSRVRGAATAALVRGGEQALPAIAHALDDPRLPRETAQRLLRACGRIGGPNAAVLALNRVSTVDEVVRSESVRALHRCGFHAGAETADRLHAQVRLEAEEATKLLACRLAVGDESDSEREDDGVSAPNLNGKKPANSRPHPPATALLVAALDGQRTRNRERILLLLACLYDRTIVLQVRDNLAMASVEQRAYAIELLDITVAGDLKPVLLPLFEDLSDGARLQRLQTVFVHEQVSKASCLAALVAGEVSPFHRWTQACAMAVAAQSGLEPKAMALALAAGLRRSTRDPLITAVVSSALAEMEPDLVAMCRLEFARNPLPGTGAGSDSLEIALAGGKPMLSPLEKVLVLRSAGLFKGTPDDILADVAGLLEEMHAEPGQVIFVQGDKGESMYLIVGGEVRVHDGEHTINYLHHGDIFGEMALLDSEPRMASVTATTGTQLLRLDQDPFYELLEDRAEVARGVIHVLSSRLRDSVAGRRQAAEYEGGR